MLRALSSIVLCLTSGFFLLACHAPTSSGENLPEVAAEAGGGHAEDRHYEVPTDPAVLAKLEQWQDLKFGLLMHWGAYSQWGIVESWSLCGEDEGWCQRSIDDYDEYRRQYEALATTFNPTGFDPQRWALAAKDAGMKYVVFTTKHHDGFCMFDTQLTDYKISGSKSAFKDHPRADIAKYVFDAFRDQGMWAGAYFSKPDWNSQNYWWGRFPNWDRGPNYDLEKYPQRWERFIEFTHGQIEELMTRYGKIDILWLDGGWVKASDEGYLAELRADPKYKFRNLQSQDIRMDEMVKMARGHQPGLIVVDRAVAGPNQNYLTPENRVPETELPFPWESCIISGGGWSHTPNAKYMSTRQGVHMLVDIVAKGGNLLLNVAPGPDGKWQQGAYDLLAGMGAWMDVNSQAIYGSRARAPYKLNNVCILDGADDAVYAIILAAEGDEFPRSTVFVPGVNPADDAEVTLLGRDLNVLNTTLALSWIRKNDGIEVSIHDPVRKTPPCKDAWTLRIPMDN